MESKYLSALRALMESKEPILEYQGALEQKRVIKILDELEHKMDSFGEKLKITRKAFNIVTEALQNVVRYRDDIEGGDEETHPCFVFERSNDFYLIACGNLLKSDKVQKLLNRLNKVNSLDWYGVQQEYKNILKNNLKNQDPNRDRNSAGLGFIEMARKSEQRFQYEFLPHDAHYTYFLILIKIAR